MNFYVKKLYANELGIRNGIPNKAGKFLLISKKRADFFPLHNSGEIDPSMSLGIIIDDMKQITLLSASSIEKDVKSNSKVNKTELSKIVAEKLAKKANDKKITKIYFDRGGYKYHGRIKIFAETLRKNGMEF